MDLLKLGASIALAMLSWHLVEHPILALKEWFRYQPSAQCPSVEIASQVTDLSSVKMRVIHGRTGSRDCDRWGLAGLFSVSRIHADVRPLRASVAVSPGLRSGLRDSGSFLSRLGSGDPGQGSGDGSQLSSTVGDYLVSGCLPVRGRPVDCAGSAAASWQLVADRFGHAGSSAGCLGPLLRGCDDQGRNPGRRNHFGRGIVAPFFPLRDDGCRRHADRDGPNSVRVPAFLCRGRAHGCSRPMSLSGCSTASDPTP